MDLFINFSQLGGGNLPRAIAMTQLNLVLQLPLLPFYLWLMIETSMTAQISFAEIWPALLVVVVPLIAEVESESWMKAQPERAWVCDRLVWWPVPLLALVVFLIAGAKSVRCSMPWTCLRALPLLVAFLLLAALIAKGLTISLRLPTYRPRPYIGI